MTLSRFVIRSGSASIELAGSVVDAPGSPEVHLTGVVSPMPLDVLKQFWPKFLAGDARKWVAQNVSGGQVLGGKVAISLSAGELARMEAGGRARTRGRECRARSCRHEHHLCRASCRRSSTGNAKLRVVRNDLFRGYPGRKSRAAVGPGDCASVRAATSFPTCGLIRNKAEITFKANGATATVLQLARPRAARLHAGRGHEAGIFRRHRSGQLRSRHADAGGPQIQGRQAARRGAARPGHRLERDRATSTSKAAPST